MASLVVVASPAPTLRKRWSHALRSMFAIHEVSDRGALERNLASLNPSVLLLDLDLPRMDFKSIAALQRLSPPTKILLLARTPDEKEAITALKAGVKGYHGADIDPYLLNKAVQMVQKGEIWVRRAVIPYLLQELSALSERLARPAPLEPDRHLDALTPREREIACLVGRGASNKEIAGHLNVADKTVKAHLTGIFRKLHVSDRVRLALLVSQSRAAN